MDLSSLPTILSTQITLESTVKVIVIGAAVIFLIGLLFHLLFGKGSTLNKALCAGIGVLCIYVLTIVIYTFSPGNLERFLVPLPFVKFSGSYLYIMDFAAAEFSDICSQILSMILLVLMYNIAASILPSGESASAVTWFLLRYSCILAAMLTHYFLTHLTAGFLPELLLSYGPIILLLCLFGSLLAGLLSFLLRLVVTVANPVVGILFSFFFSNKFGKLISQAVLTALILTALVAFVTHFGYAIIAIDPSALVSYIPLLVALTALWYVIGRKL